MIDTLATTSRLDAVRVIFSCMILSAASAGGTLPALFAGFVLGALAGKYYIQVCVFAQGSTMPALTLTAKQELSHLTSVFEHMFLV